MSEEMQSYRVIPTREMLAACIGNRCYYDQKFRERFQKDPKGCLETMVNDKLQEDTGGKVDAVSLEGIDIKLLRNSGDTWHIPLPSKEARNHEISEADLEKVSAGEVLFATSVTGSIVWFNVTGIIAAAAIAGVAATLVTGGVVAGAVVAANRV